MEKWVEEKLYFEGDTFYSDLLSELEKAQISVYFETFIFKQDHLGGRLIETLKKISQRGVNVQLLVDGVGTAYWDAEVATTLEKIGVSFKVYAPPPWKIFGFLKRMNLNAIREKILTMFFRLNHRDHRKICIIDERVAWIGSMNVVDYHLAEFFGKKAWRDTGIRVVGPRVKELIDSFHRAWSSQREKIKNRDTIVLGKKWTKEIKKKFSVKNRILRLNDQFIFRELLHRDLIKRMKKAQHRLWMTTPYFVPTARMIRIFKKKSREGVDVRLLLPHHNDVFFMAWVAQSFYKSLLEGGVKIFEYLPSVLHAKTLICDHWAMVGSSNMNHRSLFHDLEVDIVVTHPENRSKMEEQFLNDCLNSLAITNEGVQKFPLWKRALGQFFLIFKYWL